MAASSDPAPPVGVAGPPPASGGSAPTPPPAASTPRPAGFGRRLVDALSTPEGASWLFAILIAGTISICLALEILQAAIPPGGDPGTWLSTSYAYIGRGYPSQVIPLAYPPVLFPLLGLAVLGTGGPIGAAQLFAPTLYFVLGLTTFYVATLMFRSRMVALVVMTFLMIDPQLLQMVFWGAYPNLLGFVFMNMAFAGLLLMGRGRLSKGAAVFWTFAALTVLTHSLTGLVLAGTTILFLALAWATPQTASSPEGVTVTPPDVDNPRLIPRAVFFSRGGKFGLVGFALAVGAYYLITALAHVPHPDYFVSSAIAFRVIGLGGVLTAVLPNLIIVALGAVYLLLILVIGVLFFYASLYLRKPHWLTTPVLLLIAAGVIVMTTPIVGWTFKIVTDYRRFGYFLLIPLALSFGYLIDRGWAAARTPPAVPPPGAPRGPDLPPTLQRWVARSRHPRRIASLAFVAFVLGLVLSVGITAPQMGKYEATFTRVGHDQNFLNALAAVDNSGRPGGILTVPGADKWARAVTDRNVYAPYTQAAYLFYPSQILDSELAYYALTSHYAMTNGLVSAEVKGVEPGNTEGIPSYGIYAVGTFRPILKIPPEYVDVELVHHANGTVYDENLTAIPTVILPPSLGGGPMQIIYTEPNFTLTVDVAVAPTLPYLLITFYVAATAGDLIHSLSVTVIPASTTTARVTPDPTRGNFTWDTVTTNVGPISTGNVTPAKALTGVSDFDDLTGTPAVLLSYNATDALGSASVSGNLSLTTPAASTIFKVVPPVVTTPQIWSELGIEFVLMRNPAYSAQASVAYPGEVAYLESEYGAYTLYSNVEWTVLVV